MAFDPYYNNVVLLLPMEGANTSTTFTDVSPSPKAITRYGDTKISTAQSQWGRGSGYFDGSGDYVQVSQASDWTFLHNNTSYTAEFWVYLVGSSSVCIFGTNVYTKNIGMSLLINAANKLALTISKAVAGTYALYALSSSTISRNSWTHIAFTYNTNNRYVYFYINGIQCGQGTASGNSSSPPTKTLQIGRYQGDTEAEAGDYFNGYLNDLRITKDIIRYTANFTPPPMGWPPEHHSAKYLYPTTLPTLYPISGNVIISGNGGAQQVVIRDAATRLLMATATPASNGDWSTSVPAGDYDISYFAPNCQPICHGPYTVTA